MSTRTLVTLTVVEVVVLVAVLAIFLVILARGLRSITASLSRVAGSVATIEMYARSVGPRVTEVNKTLEEIVEALPGVAHKAESLADNVGGSP